ncbi:hypothetical protein HDU87_006105 [Geranomyces variabilis]|uniref:Xylanolytic transcriptional activator regulatory domain-containing protein n=1 Tax=Geranomyces variabilis TaxID=109894 RepID=A0AAD5THA7_9FUNG|nr:hypothetical protein HDU87_006105 [Geranomyces variabilis]
MASSFLDGGPDTTATSPYDEHVTPSPAAAAGQPPPHPLSHYHSGRPFEPPPVSAEVANELIALFFQFVSPFLPLIHRPSFFATRNHQSFLLYSMYAIAARFSTNPKIISNDAYRAGQPFYIAARNMADRHLDSPNPSTVVGLLILALYSVESDRGSAAWMFIGLAIRMAQELKLNIDPYCQRTLGNLQPIPGTQNWIQKEAHRRIWWYCFVQDRYAGAATDRSMIINERDCRSDLPVSDEEWDSATEMMNPLTRDRASAGALGDPAHARPLSFHAYFILLIKIFGRILDHLGVLKSTQLSNVTPALAPDPDHQLAILDSSLRAWFASLPEWLRSFDFDAEARRRPDAGGPNPEHTLWSIAYLHAFYHLSILMLHRPKMTAIARDLRGAFVLQNQSFVISVDSANQIGRILNVFKTRNPHFLYMPPYVAVCIFQSALVHVVASQLRPASIESNTATGIDSELRAVTHQAELNLGLHLRALDGMQRYWFLAFKLGSSLQGLIESARVDTRTVLGGSNFISDRPWIALKGRCEVDMASDPDEENEAAAAPAAQPSGEDSSSSGSRKRSFADSSLESVIQMSIQMYPYAVPPPLAPRPTPPPPPETGHPWRSDSNSAFVSRPAGGSL